MKSINVIIDDTILEKDIDDDGKGLWSVVLCLQNRQIPKYKKHNDGWNKQYVSHNNFRSMVAIK